MSETPKSNKTPGRKPKEVWNFFVTVGEKKEGHQGCKCKYCPWSQTRGEPNSMEAHLALSCHKVPVDIKEKFLLMVKLRGENQILQAEVSSLLPIKKRKVGNQQLITKYGEADTIEPAKQQMCDNAVAKFFICCGVSFRLVEHPFFINMVKSLCLGYVPPSAYTLSEDFLYKELANVVVDQNLVLKRTKNLTLGFDGWTSPLGQSLYAFVIFTPDRKEIIHSVKNLSADSHTSNFLANQLDEVITDIGVDNFSAIVSDHASACAAAKRIISERYKHILSIRCIAHHVNLISTDICKTTFAKEVISKCQKIVKYFKQSHQAGEELREKITSEIKGGGLKTYVVTRWTTAWDCTNSILRLEQILKNILDETPEKLSNDISELIRRRSFFTDVEAVNTLLGPVKSVVKSLEFKTTTLADCFVELIKLSQKIKSIQPVTDYDFKYQCIELFNKRWNEFDIQLYILAYLLHPHYRGKGIHPTIFRDVCILAMKIWVNMGGGEFSSADLVSQIRSFYLRESEFDHPFSASKSNVLTWWRLCNPVHEEENHIQKLALKILSITPHNAGCERVFSVLGWFANKRRTKLKVEKLEAMAKLHTHYITNAQKYLKQAYVGVSEDIFQSSIREALSNAKGRDDDDDDDDDDFSDDDDDDDEEEDRVSNTSNRRNTEIEKWIDINNSELKNLLNIEVNVVIESRPLPNINHGSSVFDVEAAVDKVLDDNT